MISNSELESIIEVLCMTEGTLEECFIQFCKQFPQDQFRACVVLVNLMNSNVITQTQRITALYLIVESFRQDTIKINPFSLNLIEFFEKSESQFERKFIYNLLVKNNKDFAKYNIRSLGNEIELTEYFKVPEDFQSFKKYISENIPSIPGFKGAEIKNVIPDFNLNDNNRYTPPKQKFSIIHNFEAKILLR